MKNFIEIKTDLSLDGLVPTFEYNFEYKQKEVTLIQPGIPFNYNKFLNIGLKKCKNDWILISNNDIICLIKLKKKLTSH